MGRYTANKPDGTAIVCAPEGGQWECDTKQCVHCGFHWHVQFGSERVRGFCMGCNGPICNKLDCHKICCPAEKQLEILEGKYGPLTIAEYIDANV